MQDSRVNGRTASGASQASPPLVATGTPSSWKSRLARISLHTSECLQFLDLTPLVRDEVRRSGVRSGFVNVQSLHTTTAILVNENEPLLISDMKKMLEQAAPRRRAYRHDDYSIRTVNLAPGESPNGHSHCKAILLGASETLNIVDGSLELGRWQSIFLVELDRPRPRTVSLMILGCAHR